MSSLELTRIIESLESELEKANRLIKGIKKEAQGYRDDHMKCVNWLCENGYGHITENPVDFIINLLDLHENGIERILDCEGKNS